MEQLLYVQRTHLSTVVLQLKVLIHVNARNNGIVVLIVTRHRQTVCRTADMNIRLLSILVILKYKAVSENRTLPANTKMSITSNFRIGIMQIIDVLTKKLFPAESI
jgi:hypothetical protein